MNNKLYIGLVVLILVAGGAYLFMGSNNKLEAPVVEDSEGVLDSSMPVPVNDGGTLPSDTQVFQDDSSQANDAGLVASVKEFTVEGKNFSFIPATMTVKKGDTVKITFKNVEGFHDLKIDEFNVATKQIKAPGEEVIEFVADKAGSFEYYCTVGSHRAMGMKGTLTVTE